MFCIFLQKTFVVEDCWGYGFDDFVGTFTKTDDEISNLSVDTGLNSYTFPSNFEISYKYYTTDSGSGYGNLLWLIGASKTNGVLIGTETSNKRIRIYNRTNTNSLINTANNVFSINTWTDVSIAYNNGVWTINCGGQSLTYTKSFTAVMILTYEAFPQTKIKDFKIKAL